MSLDIRRQFLSTNTAGPAVTAHMSKNDRGDKDHAGAAAHPLLADSLLAVGKLKISLCKLGEGLRRIQESQEMRKKLSGGIESPQYAAAQLEESLACLTNAHFDKASELAGKSLNTLKACYAEPHSLLASCLRVEARCQLEMGVTENAVFL